MTSDLAAADRRGERGKDMASDLNTDGFNTQVFEPEDANPGWMVMIMRRGTVGRIRGRKRFPSIEKAKLAAFDALMWAKSKLS